MGRLEGQVGIFHSSWRFPADGQGRSNNHVLPWGLVDQWEEQKDLSGKTQILGLLGPQSYFCILCLQKVI